MHIFLRIQTIPRFHHIDRKSSVSMHCLEHFQWSLMASPQMFNMRMLILPWPRALFLFSSILKIAELQKIYSGQTITSKMV